MHCQVNKLPVFECEPTQATQAEVTDEQILEVAEHFGAFEYGDAQGHKRIDFARAILALRPSTAPNLSCKSVQARLAAQWGYVRPASVPMTDEEIESLLVNWPKDGIAFFEFARAIEAHHGITAQAKKEGA